MSLRRPRRPDRDAGHPCVSECFGRLAVTVSLVSGRVYESAGGKVRKADRVEAAMWVQLVRATYHLPDDDGPIPTR